MQSIAYIDNVAPRIENMIQGQLASLEDRHSNADVGEIMRTLANATWIQKNID